MGAGKSTTGRRLASLLEWDYIDIDDVVEEIEGETIKTIFAEKGEAEFRKMEKEALHSLASRQNCVISTGGGTPCFFDNMDFMLDNGFVVYLEMTPGQLKSRLEMAKVERPLLMDLNDSQLIEMIKTKLAERKPFYERANLIVDGMGKTQHDILEELKRK